MHCNAHVKVNHGVPQVVPGILTGPILTNMQGIVTISISDIILTLQMVEI